MIATILLALAVLVIVVTLSRGRKRGRGIANATATMQEYFLPDLSPERDRSYVAHSESVPGKQYAVNIYQMTCTCPDFAKRRSVFQRLDARRMCKHLASRLEEKCGVAELGQPAYAVVRTAARYGPSGAYKVVFLGPHSFLVMASAGKEWMSVIVRGEWPPQADRFKNYAFGYSLIERRWSYGRAPRAHKEIAEFLNVVPVDALGLAATPHE
ncbi:MAG: hypothetical protein U0167_15205 [bacterium]